MVWAIWRAARSSRSPGAVGAELMDDAGIVQALVLPLPRSGSAFRRRVEHGFGCLTDVLRARPFPWRWIALLKDAGGAVGQGQGFDHFLHGLLKRLDAQIVGWRIVGGRLVFIIFVHRSRPNVVACAVRINSNPMPAVTTVWIGERRFSIASLMTAGWRSDDGLIQATSRYIVL